MKKRVLYSLLFLANTAFSQNTIEIQLKPLYNGQPISINQLLTDANGTDFKITRMEYYLHEFAITHDGGQSTTLSTSDNYVLANANSLFYTIGTGNIVSVESIGFKVGVDTSLNHDDPSLYPMGHPLGNQTPSMHWGWAAGYRFLALEAEVDADGDGVMETLLQSHIVGDQFIKTVSPITISNSTLDGSTVKIALTYDINLWLTNVDVATAGVNHGAGAVNGTIMGNTDPMNVFAEGTITSIENNSTLDASISSISANSLSYEAPENIIRIEIFDVSGKLLISESPNQSAGTLEHNLSSGIYIIRLSSESKTLSKQIKL